MTQATSNCPSCGSETRPGMIRCRECGRTRNGHSHATNDQPSTLVPPQPELATESIATVLAANSTPRPHTRRSGGKPSRRKPTSDGSTKSQKASKGVNFSPKPKRAIPRKDVSQPWYRRGVVIAAAVVLTGATAIAVAMNTNTNVIAPVQSTDDLIPLTPDRAAAIWVVENYGVVTVELESGDEAKFVAKQHLPNEPFSVTKIDLWHQPIDGNELAFLGNLPRLNSLDLSRTGITDAHMRFVARAKNLHRLSLRHTPITTAGFEQLPIYEDMFAFTASANRAFNDESLITITQKIPNVRTLLFTSTAVTDAGFANLNEVKSLRDVRFENVEISETVLAEFKKQRPRCRLKY